MSLRSLLDALRSIPPLPRTGRRVAFRPRLEPLDDRSLPSFLTPVNYDAGANPFAVVANDFDNDGVLDLAVTNYGSVPVR